MTARDVTQLRAQLDAIAAAIRQIHTHAEDLHSIGYEAGNTGDHEGDGNAWPPPGVENTGDPRARDLWRRLTRDIRPLEVNLRAIAWAVGNLLAAGPSPEPTRGSLIPKAELAAQIRRQRQHQADGDYTPQRIEKQPDYPGSKPGGR